jgi:hypothetical protein
VPSGRFHSSSFISHQCLGAAGDQVCSQSVFRSSQGSSRSSDVRQQGSSRSSDVRQHDSLVVHRVGGGHSIEDPLRSDAGVSVALRLSRSVSHTDLYSFSAQYGGRRSLQARAVAGDGVVLKLRVVQGLFELWGLLQVDLFATPWNSRLQTFVSPFSDERTSEVDTLSVSCSRCTLTYAFPPWKLLGQVRKF